MNPNSCQCCGGIYRRGYFCLIQIPEIKKESSANNFVTSRGQRGPKRATGTYCNIFEIFEIFEISEIFDISDIFSLSIGGGDKLEEQIHFSN